MYAQSLFSNKQQEGFTTLKNYQFKCTLRSINFTNFLVSSGTYSVNEDASVIVNAEEAVPVDHLDKDVSFTF